MPVDQNAGNKHEHEVDHPNARLYCELMEYLKWRVEAVQETIKQVRERRYFLANRLAAEFCVLQLRMSCELLAIGCIAIHTDVPQSKRLQKEWNAGSVMKEFSRLKPSFFPQGIRSETLPDGTIQQVASKGAMTKHEFLKAYNWFGGLLHTGNYDGYRSSSVRSYDFSALDDFVEKLGKLLSDHVYTLHDGKEMFRVIMFDQNDGRVRYNYLVAHKANAST